MPRPRIQFTTEPSVLPAVAATKSNTGSLRPEVSRPRSTSSDETEVGLLRGTRWQTGNHKLRAQPR